MTLKSSSSNKQGAVATQAVNPGISVWQLTCKAVKRHIWLPILALLGFVLALPVSSALAINNFLSYYSEAPERFVRWCRELMILWQSLTACIIVVGALLSVFVLFRYLHVRTQVDFYHSLPVRRERFFFSNLLAVFLVFFVPYLAGTLLNLLVLAISGWLVALDMSLYLQFFLLNVLVYMLIAGCGCLAMQLSGSMPSAIKILLMTFGLAPLAAGMYEMLGSCFLDTWVTLFSPISLVLLKACVLERYAWLSASAGIDADLLMTSPIVWQDWLAAVVLTVAMLGASLWLYQRRRSEVAGSTLAFAWQKPIYKYPLVICSGLMLGVFFYLMGERSLLWLYFGAVLGTMFMALLMEVFIKSDFKAVKQGWKSALVASVAVCLVLSGYAFDWLGFDSKVPAADEVQMVYLESSSLQSVVGDSYNHYYYNDDDYFSSYWSLNRSEILDYSNMLTFSEPENKALVLALVAESHNIQDEFNSYDYYSSYDGPYSAESMQVVYKMNNGSMQARNYWSYNVLDEVHQKTYEQLLASSEWRGQLALNNLDTDKIIITELYSYALGSSRSSIYPDDRDDTEWAKLVAETIQKEFGRLSVNDLLYTAPIGNVEISSYSSREYREDNEDNGSGYYSYENMRYNSVLIFPAMTETIALLNEKYGNLWSNEVDMQQIAQVREYRRLTEKEIEALESSEATDTSYVDTVDMDKLLAVYTPEEDAAAVRAILDNAVSERAIWHCGFWNSRMFDTYYEIDFYSIDETAEDYEVTKYDDSSVYTLTCYPTPSQERWNQLVYRQ